MSKNLLIDNICKINRIISRGYTSEGKPRSFTDIEFFQVSVEMGINQHNKQYRKMFELLAQWIDDYFKPKAALEIGCGPGYLLKCLNKLGINTIGIDGNKYSKQLFVTEHPEYESKYFLDNNFNNDYKPVDVLIAIECFEHIPDDALTKIMDKIAKTIQPNFIIFSSTPYFDPNLDWDVMWGHINVKTSQGWIDLFKRNGYDLVLGVSPPITSWALLFQKRVSNDSPPFKRNNFLYLKYRLINFLTKLHNLLRKFL